MIEFYPDIKWVHVAAVITSGALFLLRGVAAQAGASWPTAAPLRYVSYTVDTVLLTAALMLVTILPAAMFSNGWLAVKLTLVVCYVILGTYALKRGRTQRVRLLCFLAGAFTYASVISVAWVHHPLGLLLLLTRS